MPSPKTVSDDNILDAALQVLADRGTNFTLSDLARHVGLSRPTLAADAPRIVSAILAHISTEG